MMIRSVTRSGPRDEDLRFRVVLAADELLANSVVHTTGGCTIAAWLRHRSGPRIRVEVTDRSEEQPVMHIDGAFRGLRILDQVTTRRGVEPRTEGKAVWFEIT